MDTKQNRSSRTAVIYSRTAMFDSSEVVHSQQRAICEKELKDIEKMIDEDIQIKEHIADNGVTSEDQFRPGMYRLIDSVNEGDVDIVAIADANRLTRSTSEFWELINMFNEHCIDLVVCDSSSIGVRGCTCSSENFTGTGKKATMKGDIA